MPIRSGTTVLTDANTMIEAHRVGCWKALTGAFQVETVEKCVEETQTGNQRRSPEEIIDPVVLRASLGAVHPVTLRQRVAATLAGKGPHLDEGELDLWAHALTRADVWVLCGPDAASMRFGFLRGHRERLVSLESLLTHIGFRPAIPLRANYLGGWLDGIVLEMTMDALRKR